MSTTNISSIATAGIVRGAVDDVVDGPAHDGLFPADSLLELLSFLPHQEVRMRPDTTTAFAQNSNAHIPVEQYHTGVCLSAALSYHTIFVCVISAQDMRNNFVCVHIL